ncbi:MAG TPA: tRNA (adenosine(37)-N6)-threonylcarbamoyltransferase complex dimerization subunit type 1 TsaB [Candidatus Omnitrophica bacterium]|nr:tRNA (adenosine(37)-N6)-threonylcarbamoyltransferase complex dimerization subunit type 1 TsaB [Candidatus Omnitrophota bacterium]
MRILGIQTSTSINSIALVDGEEILGEYSFNSSSDLSKELMVSIDLLLNRSHLHRRELSGIAVATGPGSFTGVRIGLSVSKGLSLGLDIPVVGISTLEGLCYNFSHTPYMICPMLISRKEEVYTALYRYSPTRTLRKVEGHRACSLRVWLKKIGEPVVFVGEGAVKYRNVIRRRLEKLALFAPPSLNHLRASDIAFQAPKRLKRIAKESSLNLRGEYLRSPVERKI